MTSRIALAQIGYPPDGTTLEQISTYVTRACEQEADIVVFPENAMCLRPLAAPELLELAEPLDGPYVQYLCDLASVSHIWIVTTMYEHHPQGFQPYNTCLVIDDHGSIRMAYRKTHLYDAHGVHESERMSRGDAIAPPVETPFGTLGVGICYDLRFPEHARTLALSGCDMIVYPSSWHDGPQKLVHWRTLLSARAIENELFIIGVCHSYEGNVGHSLIVDPLGNILVEAQDVDDGKPSSLLLVKSIDVAEKERARQSMPVLDHRMPHLYTALT